MLEIAFGSLIAIIITVIIEYLRNPKLELKFAPPTDINYPKGKPAKNARFVKLELFNKPLPKMAQWMSRNAALQCHGKISFYHLDGQNVFGRSMPIRWTSAPEPASMQISLDKKQILITDPKFTLEPRVDIYPGEYERLNVAAMFNNEKSIYGWCNQNYFSDPLWLNPHWKLSSNRYIIKVSIFSSGKKIKKIFRLIGDVSQNDFRIENALPSDSIFDID